MMVLVGELSARGAGRPLISRGRRGGIGHHGLVPREGALSALAPAGFCAEGIAHCAKAFGSASPLQLAKVEEFYVVARLARHGI